MGIETPDAFRGRMEGYGEGYGSAVVPSADALGEDAAPNRFAQAGSELRMAVAEEDHLSALAEPRQTVAEAPGQSEAAAKKVPLIRQRLQRLKEALLPGRRQDREAAAGDVTQARGAYEDLSASEQGYITSRLVLLAIVIGVPVFDAFVIHSALEHAGLGTAALWGTTFTVPIAIWAVNHSLGMVAGALAVKLPEERIRMAAIAGVAGGGALLVSFVMLAIFRHQSAEGQNAALEAIANGDLSQQLDLFLSPLWMGPLQIAGSMAAIVAVALWTAAIKGRRLAKRIREAEERLADSEQALAIAEGRIEAVERELEQAEVAPLEIAARAAAAQARIATLEEMLVAQRRQERALGKLMSAIHEAKYTETRKVHENGGVWRCAMPTAWRFFSRFTPPPTVKQAGIPLVEPSRNGNGHHAGDEIDPSAFRRDR